jgi:hypothetical protein
VIFAGEIGGEKGILSTKDALSLRLWRRRWTF